MKLVGANDGQELRERLGANVTRLATELAATRKVKLCHLWRQLCDEGWPGENVPAKRRALKQIAAGERWPEADTFATIARVLGVKPWTLLR